MASGAFLRVFMQEFPSVEPITFFAIMSGWLFGSKKGFAVGSSSLYLSNFFMFGGQGPWTPFQLVAFGAAGYLGGFLKGKEKTWKIVGITVISTIIFEIIMNISSMMFLGGNILLAFYLALPFTLVHLTSNITFSLFLPKIKTKIEKEGGFNEKKFVTDTIAQFKSGKLSRKS